MKRKTLLAGLMACIISSLTLPMAMPVSAATAYADGVYQGTGEGFKGDITVSVTVEQGAISDIAIVSQRDTEKYFNKALALIPSMISAQSANVDSISGASYSSAGIKEATANALAKAIVEIPETEAPETEAPETKAPETEAPETEAPETEAPETETPETKAPETEAPETETPETKAPETKSSEKEDKKKDKDDKKDKEDKKKDKKDKKNKDDKKKDKNNKKGNNGKSWKNKR